MNLGENVERDGGMFEARALLEFQRNGSKYYPIDASDSLSSDRLPSVLELTAFWYFGPPPRSSTFLFRLFSSDRCIFSFTLLYQVSQKTYELFHLCF